MDFRRWICTVFLASLSISRGQHFRCPLSEWQCDDGNCIPDVQRCDGNGDCLDGSDEMACTGSHDCPAGQFPCVDSVGCVDASSRCDGQNQCPTGSDEENCAVTKGCLDSDWTCRNHICIPKELRCNGWNDCLDNSDEEDCGPCGSGGVRCPEGRCLTAAERCDGTPQCSDGSDEPMTCGRVCSLDNGGCSHECVDEPRGARCACPLGYELSPSGAACDDLDECAKPFDPCMHYCSNTVGSYYCHCREGFILNGSATCLPTGNATRLLIVQRSSIGLLNVKTERFEAIAHPGPDPVALAFDVARGSYFWADDRGSIYKSDGRHSLTIYNGEPGINSLACDWLNGHLFWANRKTESIYMQAADGKSYTTLLSRNTSPSELLLIPVESLMFWISGNLGERVTLEKSWMDASERSTLAVLTAQSAHSLTADVAARRLYWVSDSKKSVETVKVDGTGRYSFPGMFDRRSALALAVFDSHFYWVDDDGLWQVAQNQPNQKQFIWRGTLPILAAYHELQQPQGSSACRKTPCHLCQLTKGNAAGFSCTCPNAKVLMLDGTCEYPRFLYATSSSINMLEFRGSSNIQLFTTDDGILSFDVDWYRDWLYWTNQTGHIQRTSLTLVKVEVVPTHVPACLIKIDQMSGDLYWVSCDQKSIGTATADNQYPHQLYHTANEIRDLNVDWLRGDLLWLEGDQVLTMSMTGGNSKKLLHLAGGRRGAVAFDLRANSLTWNSKTAGLTTMSLLQERSHRAGGRWNVSGSVIAAFEPFLLSLSDNVVTLWDRRDGSLIRDVIVWGRVHSVIPALAGLGTVPNTTFCSEPSVMCRHTLVCLPQEQLCDGKKDCPEGDDEDLCVATCPSEGDFKCKDGRSCISGTLVCDGRPQCRDGSDEVDCQRSASRAARSNLLKCRMGSKLCGDGTECVLYMHVCDGERDCRDGSDEQGCDAADTATPILSENHLPTKSPAPTKPACISPSVLCAGSSVCITPNQLCDGKKDCPDGSDEKCVNRCPKRNFRCKDRRSCVSRNLVCDGISHCHDGSDEVDCPSDAARPNVLKCRMGSRMCQDGTECVLFSHVCDGDRDCQDGSDEEGCDAPESATSIPPLTAPPAPTKPSCISPSVLCAGSSVCITPNQLCDGKKDCPDGSDENCVNRCPKRTDFRCKDRRSCVSRSLVCDGISHCHDGSDEVDCQRSAPPAARPNALKCRVGSTPCGDGTECVLYSHVCDGERDCQDGSDEQECDAAVTVSPTVSGNPVLTAPPAPTKPSCISPSVLCAGSSVCITSNQLCDGKEDCPDGSDENCVNRCPKRTDFRCKDRRSCVSRNLVCDGISHCHDGSDEVDCPSDAARTNVVKCRMGSRMCQDGTECVLFSHVCDGDRDCQDGSDEEGCDAPESATSIAPLTEPPAPTKPACISPSVLCAGSSVCITPNQLCDGKKDCPDGSDENCVNRCPRRTDFRCKDRRSCISSSLVCDGISHCHDGSDEVDCQRSARPNALKCRVGSTPCGDGTECVLYSHVCDGERDCQDGSDEQGCDAVTASPTVSGNPVLTESPAPTKPSCISPSVLCAGSSVCITSNQLCDGKKDCPDGSDEKCVNRCPKRTDFRCKDRRSCVSRNLVCDGISHCHDGSDEVDCPSDAARANVVKCRMGSRMCQDGTGCVLFSHVCDGDRDCQDGSDEEGCYAPESATSIPHSTESPAPTKPACISPSVLCAGSSVCITPNQLCDGKEDCPDGSDEKCVNRCPKRTDFRCKDRRSCISSSLVCDGISHCHDGSDEVDCQRSARPNALKCRVGSTPCGDGTECVLYSHVCDGERDCQDGSDEQECDAVTASPTVSVNPVLTEPPAPTKPSCISPSVLCAGSSVCITSNQLCDGKKDCPDGSDEKCVNRCPKRTDFRCKDRRSCVSRNLVCDGISHCHDGSDEVDCPSDAARPNVLKCRMGSRMCQDGTECVLFSHVCDGDKDCQDGSDEEGCDAPESATSIAPLTEPPAPTKPACISPSVLCAGSSVCITPNQLCDGKKDCPDGSDENCVNRCPKRTDFRCKDRRSCVSRNLVCDAIFQCHDGSDEVDCPSDARANVAKCRMGSRMCQDGTECVLFSHVCDGKRDCQDGSDEEGCDAPESATSIPPLSEPPAPTKPACISPSVLCAGSSVCITPNQLCDGKKDCPDGSDEKCINRCPRRTDFRCKDRRSCISRNLVCDGISHCHDGSDEVDCPNDAARSNVLKCRMGSTPCGDGTECVLYSHVCDGERDCQDGSDEQGCDISLSTEVPPAIDPPPLTMPPCVSPSVLCPSSSAPLCISPRQFCDGRQDCPDGFDEENCVRSCPSKNFRCKDRRSCISQSLVCDGRAHCYDGSDEVDCPNDAPRAARLDVLKCRMGSRMCQDGTECVLFSHVCDGETDCQDGSDEEGCDAPESATSIAPLTEPPAPTKPACISPSVLCAGSSVCITPNQLCDGKKDCPDGSDEKCVNRCPRRTDFRCKDRRSCVSRNLVCDGISHCHDGSDEVDCPNDAPRAARPDVLKCRMGSRMCQDGTECVLFSHVCDGETDCQDGSDEEGCDTPESATSIAPLTDPPAPTKPACISPSVLCAGSSVCITPNQLCDGKDDCPDGSDEKCVNRCPRRNDFQCKDRRSCVSRNLVCDGISHCHDGSDEVHCPSWTSLPANVLKCRVGSKPCDDALECVLHSHVCDGERDCLDGSDEQGCAKTCNQGEFQCSHGKMCIPEAEVCDGRSQCSDRSDEVDCEKPGTICEHRCADGNRCIPKTFLCDGEKDCLDGTDELGCDADAETAAFPVPTAASACMSPSVRCPGSPICIAPNQLCDGQRHCPDGFDEKDCVLQCDNPDDFLCGDRRMCVPKMDVCDGHAHCADGSDEEWCESAGPTDPTSNSASSDVAAPLRCRQGLKPCKDGLECVMYSHVCDGEQDCQDGSDEEDCAAQCQAGEFRCAHGSKCIPTEQVCDGQNDCQDRSDEMDCSSQTEGCLRRCDNNTRCVPDTFLCDGERDCADGSDEDDCDEVACTHHQYRCLSGQCVAEALRCDGYADCTDHSDEAHCTRPPRCPTELRCPNSHECLQREWLCDGEDDCKDGSDEKNCLLPPVMCNEHQWQCGDGNECIPLSWRCDGTKDCLNGVDEVKCGQTKCPPGLYRCGSGECLDPLLVCDGFTNCADNSDEGAGCARRNCSSPSAPRCDHSCVSTPNGPSCFCAAGFTLRSSGVSCVDIDECKAVPHVVCQHTCRNTRGSYICQCLPGFYLEPDHTSCKTRDEPLLLASVQSELLLVGVQSGSLRQLTSVNRPVFSLDYLWALQRVYWLSTDYQSIRWADMTNSDSRGTLIKGVKSDFIAVDWVGNNLYWVNGLLGQILAVKLSNTTLRSQDYTVVLGEDLEQPSSLVLLPHRGTMLWSEIGSTPVIGQSGMDGSRRKVVVSQGLSWPVGLSYDLLDNRVYWADEKLRCIGSASPDGKDVKILQLAETPSPFSVAVFNDRVFWSDTKRRTVRSANKNTGKDQKVLLKRPGQPFGLKLMHSLSQPAVSNPCARLHCSHICLLAPGVSSVSRAMGAPWVPAVSGILAVCRCPKGLLLSKDQMTCSLPLESMYILLLSPTNVYQIYLNSIRREGVGLKQMASARTMTLPGVTRASGLDLSLQDLSLYVADEGQRSVEVLIMSGSRSRQGLTPAGQILKLNDDEVTALAVDWVTSNLYWSSTARPDVHVTARRDGYTTVLLQGSLKGTTSIALHPPSGKLCYIAMVGAGATSHSEVSCAWMDGRNKAVLWGKSSIPTSLAFSDRGSMIYWADTGEGIICSIGVDGTGFKQYKTGPGLLTAFTHTEDVLFWTTVDKDLTRLWFSDGLQPNQLWFETKTSVVEVQAHSNASQSGTNGCSKSNGGCVHLCLPYPGGRACKCGLGFYSANASVTCAPLPGCTAGEHSCYDGTKCVVSSKFCDGEADCPDGSDEQDCPNTNSASFWTTSSDGRPSPPHPNNVQKNSMNTDSSACGLQRCNGLGRCITEGEVTRCQCVAGYQGESCEEAETGRGHVAVILGVFFLVTALTLAAFVFAKRRDWPSLRSGSSEKETLMENMDLPCGHYDSDCEELDSPVDVKNPPLALKSL